MDSAKYEALVENYHRAIVRTVLTMMENKEKDAPARIFLTFRTQFPGVSIPDSLRRAYPEEMSVAIQDMFWNLSVGDEGFSIELLFDDQRQVLRIAFRALVTFMDPDAEFALHFDWEAAMPALSQSNVIFLDKFRDVPSK